LYASAVAAVNVTAVNVTAVNAEGFRFRFMFTFRLR
jgi:hypothetical protein